MASSLRTAAPRPVSGHIARVVATAIATIGLGLWPGAHAASMDGTPGCGADTSPDEALKRLNAARAHGAFCDEAGQRPAAGPLQWSQDLAAVAAAQSRDMASLDRLGHEDAKNRRLGERLRTGGYQFSAAAENVAVGYPSLEAVVEAWLKSESHCVNIMNTAVRELGVACVDGGKSGDPVQDRYWTMVVGTPKRNR